MSPYRVTAYMTQIQLAEWEFPEELRMLIATPLSHAAAAFFIPVLQKGGAFYVMQGFSPDEFFDMVRGAPNYLHHAGPGDAVLPAGFSARRRRLDRSSMETIFYGASPMSPARLVEGIEKWGQVFYQFFGQSECPMVIANMSRQDHDLTKPQRLSSCGRPSPWIHMTLAGSRRQRGCPGRSRRSLRPRPTGYEGLQGHAGADRRGFQPAAGCTPGTSANSTRTASCISSIAPRT